MAGRLEDKVAIVTGGASGIGRAICQRFGREGAKVVVADRNINGAEETLSLMGATPDNGAMVDVNISDAFQVERMVQDTVTQFGRLDVLINGAAILIRTPPLVEVDEVLWDLTMETNVKGVFLSCKYAIPAMTANGGGSIVNISSMSGVRGVGYSVPYAVAKAGVISLTRTLALELAAYGVRVNAVCPGPVYTDFNKRNMAQRCETLGIGEDEMIERIRTAIPLGRWGEPEDIARGVAFLCSPEAGWITGEIMRVSGGMEGVSATPPKRPRN